MSKKFSSTGATIVLNGDTFTGNVLFDGPSDAQQIQYIFASGSSTESEFYLSNARYQICGSNTCNGYYITLGTPAYDLINPITKSPLSAGSSTNFPGIGSCNLYTYTQDGTTVKIWALSTDSTRICQVSQVSSSFSRIITFTNWASYTGTLSKPSATTYPGCATSVQCGSAMDLVLVIDQSGSINSTEFTQEISYVRTVASSFVMGELGVKIGYILFNSQPNVVLNLIGNQTQLLYAIDHTVQTDGETNIGDAIWAAHNLFAAGRSSAPNIILLLTDGVANMPDQTITGVLPAQYAYNKATAAKNAGDLIFGVGVGTGVADALATLTSGPDYLASVNDFAALNSTLSKILSTICTSDTDSCVSSSLNCNSEEFCGCGECICTIDASSCGTRGNFNSDTCQCDCVGNWKNQNGDLTCSTCGLTSSNCTHGTLNTTTCSCSCDVNWNGTSCNQCTKTCPTNANVVNCASCQCKDFWTGANCDQCNASACYSPHGVVANPTTCNSCNCTNSYTTASNCQYCGLTCVHGSANGDCSGCTCDPNWTGPTCNSCGLTNTNCNNNGSPKTNTCDKCNCANGYTGTWCDSCSSGYCKNNATQGFYPNCGCTCVGNWNGTQCDNCKLNCNNGQKKADCSGCDCTPPWGGSDCTTCQLNCNHGVVANSATCSGCNCTTGWTDSQSGYCNVCVADLCNYRGTANSTCNGCTCYNVSMATGTFCENCDVSKCHNFGFPDPSCSNCICNHNWSGNQCDTCSGTNFAAVSVPCVNGDLTDNSAEALSSTTCFPMIISSNVTGEVCFSSLGDILYITPYFQDTLSNSVNLTVVKFVSTTDSGTAITWAQNSYSALNSALSSATDLIGNKAIAKSTNGKVTPGPTITVMGSGLQKGVILYVGMRLKYSGSSSDVNVFSSLSAGSRVLTLNVQQCTDCVCNYNCNSHGTPNYEDCTKGCNCIDSWVGKGCDTCNTSAKLPCSNHGNITENTVLGTCNECTCDQYWEGTTCSQCKFPCQNSGTPITPGCSSCSCPAPWNGTDCSSCNFNVLCNGHGTNSDANCNSCNCSFNWDPTSNCKDCSLDCNDRGSPDNNCNVCNCSSNIYSGDTCDQCVEEVLCNGRGVIDDSAPFCSKCVCDDPSLWGGDRCDQCLYECNSPNGSPVTTCDSCDCHGAWGATDCSVCDVSENSTYCSGRGTVNNPTGDCDTCTCTQRWSGQTCSQCTFSCHGHGTRNSECTACECTAGSEWTVESDCQVCAMECFNGGTHNSACTSCNCVNGWGGKYCDTCVTAVSECVHENSTASPIVVPETCSCVCSEAWIGRLCDQCPLPEGGCNYPNGFVIYSADHTQCFCSCSNHFSGVDCNECVYECESTRVMDIGDCSCHCPKYFKDDETCNTCILTPSDCVHPADQPATVDLDTCNCHCLGGWGDRDCSICTLDPNGAPLGYAFNETSCEYYILCGNGIVNNPPEDCEDTDEEGNVVEYPECCDDCHFNTVPCNDNNDCTINDKCYFGTCMGFSEFDWTLDPSRADIPSGMPISTGLFSEWGLVLQTLTETNSLIFVDTAAPGTGRENLKLPSTNAFGGDNNFPRVVALQTPNNAEICVYMNPPLALGAITVVGAYDDNTFVSTFCGNGTEINKPVSTYSTNVSAAVEYFELQCGSSGVSRVCIMNAKHAALGPIFMSCEGTEPAETSTIGDFVWYDYNMNGLQDEDLDNSGVAGVSVSLYTPSGQLLRSTQTNQNGYYLFPNLYAGYYVVKFVIPSTLHFTSALNLGTNYWVGSTNTFALGSNQTDLTRDAGVIYLGAIGDYVWYDLDENGIQDGNPSGVPNVTMNLYYSDDLSTVISTTQTDSDGRYHFTGLKVEVSKGVFYNYIVELVPPALSSITKPFQGSSILSDSNFNPTGTPHLSNVVTLTPSNLVDNTIDGGIYYCCGSIGDTVWYDTDKDGLQNGEAGAPGVNVFLSWNGNVIDSTTTGSDGTYLFTGLSLSGSYRVFFERPSGKYIFTRQRANNGNSLATDSNPDKNGYTDLITLTVQNPNDITIDAGLVEGCTTAADCSTDNACQTASCIANECSFTPKTVCPASTEPCANNVCNPLTGTCSLVPKNITCSDNNPCTSNDKCTISGCVGEPDDSHSCSDGDACSTDECFGGICISSPKDCSSSVGTYGQCQTPTCGSTGCTIVNVTDNTPCNDGSKCTTGDVCRNGVCSGTPVTCGNGDQCSTIACSPSTGECVTTYLTNKTCNDNNACTEGDKCTSTGFCSGTPKNCSGTPVSQCYVPVCSGGLCVPVFQQIPCSDGNPCTVDSCNPNSKLCESIATTCPNPGPCKRSLCSSTTGQCTVVNDDTLTCSDGDSCTTDRCSAGECVSTQKNCTTTNPCKYSSCVNGACVEQNNAESCSDNNACTTNDVCTNGACSGTPIVCEDNNPCTSNSCVNGTCVFTPLSNVTCDDGSKCTRNSYCVSGVCKGYDPVVCNDGNVCTTDSCSEETGECTFVQNAANCTLADKCMKNGICQYGACVGEPVSCDLPNNQCVLSICLNDKCQYQPDLTKQNSSCDDGLICTENDVCYNGLCAGTPVVCEQSNVCYNYHCDPVNGCVPTPNTANCDDSNPCTFNDVCSNGVCAGTPVNCEDGDVCTNNYCEAGVCKFNYTTNPCSDNNACTTGDTCASGLCVGVPVICADGNICTDEVCNPLTGNCDVSFHNGISCSDQNQCTTGDSCLNGACVGSPIQCSGSNVCMDYTCNLLNGTCQQTPVTTRRNCNDNDRCTIVDICVDGTCTGRPVVCPTPTHSCEAWSCNGNTGVCEKQLLSGNSCSDGNSCTSGDVCVSGVCQGTPIDGCGNTCESTCTAINPCFTATCVSNTCVQTAKPCQANTTCVEYACNIASGQCEPRYPSNLCDDNNKCTQFDICVEGICVGTSEKTCTATAKCTTQQCNPSTGNCDVQTITDGITTCDDSNKCTVNDICSESGVCTGTTMNCNDNNPCTDDLCSNGVCVHINNNAHCEDGNSCTQNDFCLSGECQSGAPLDCSDGNVCTEDFCKDGICIHESIPGVKSCSDNSSCTENDSCFGVVCQGTPLNCDDSNPCTVDSCANGVCVHSNVADGSTCNDNDVCTTNDRCTAGTCAGAPKCAEDSVCQSSLCNAATGDCIVLYNDGVSCQAQPGLCDANTNAGTCSQGECVLPPRNCDDGNECTDEWCDETSGCIYMDSFSTCTPENGDACSTYACVLGECSIVVDNDCSDNNPCTVDSCSPEGECVHTPVAGGSCTDNNECTINDVCLSDGTCKGQTRPCNDGNVCTADSCVTLPIAPFWGCDNVPANDGIDCQFDRCTNGTCQTGICFGSTSIVDCPAQACKSVSCSSVSGSCVYEDTDDSSLCVPQNCKIASCSAGGCVYNTNNCAAQNAANTNRCTRFICQGNNQCVEIALDDGTSCGDSNSCTSAVCQSGQCNVQNADCSDDDLCTYDERCDLQEGCLATPYSCFLSPCIYYSCNDQGSCNVNSQISTFSEKIYVVFNDETHSQLLAYNISNLSEPDYVVDYPERNYIYSLAIQPHSGVVYANVERLSVYTIPREDNTQRLQNTFSSTRLGLEESSDDISLRPEFVSSSRAYDYDIYVTETALVQGKREGSIYNENKVAQGAYSYPFNDKYLAWEPHGEFYVRFVVTAGTSIFTVTSVYPDDDGRIITLCTGNVHANWQLDRTTVIGLDISYSGLLFVGTILPTGVFVVSINPNDQTCAMNLLGLGGLPAAAFATFAVDDTVCPGTATVPVVPPPYVPPPPPPGPPNGPPPPPNVPPPPGPVAHVNNGNGGLSGGGNGGNVAPGEDSNVVLTGATGNATTGVVGGVSVALIGACMIFGAILALNSSKEKQPDNLAGILETNEVSGVAMENPTYAPNAGAQVNQLNGAL